MRTAINVEVPRTNPHPVAGAPAVLAYERQLDSDPEWALSEGSRHFEENSAVFAALRKITARLHDLGIAYAVVGGMALFRHGFRRFTEDVDILVTAEGLRRLHEALDGLGYLPLHRHSRNLRDTELGVRIEFLTSGGFPGDGKPKPVAFPDPAEDAFEAEGIRYLGLPKLVELKLASGMTNPGRLRDLADVMELIRLLGLTAEFAQQLNPYVQAKYLELESEARPRYVGRIRINDLSPGQRQTMERDGLVLEERDGYLHLTTRDPSAAEKYELLEESEYWAGPDAENEA